MSHFRNGVGWSEPPIETRPPEPSAYEEYAKEVRHAPPAHPHVVVSSFIKSPSLKQLMGSK